MAWSNNPLTTPVWLRWVGAIVALFFPFINAPIEETMYRGYAQPEFTEGFGKPWQVLSFRRLVSAYNIVC